MTELIERPQGVGIDISVLYLLFKSKSPFCQIKFVIVYEKRLFVDNENFNLIFPERYDIIKLCFSTRYAEPVACLCFITNIYQSIERKGKHEWQRIILQIMP